MFRREQIGTCAERLAKLDKGGSQICPRHARLLRLGVRRFPDGMAEPAALKRQQVARSNLHDQPAQAVAGQGGGYSLGGLPERPAGEPRDG